MTEAGDFLLNLPRYDCIHGCGRKTIFSDGCPYCCGECIAIQAKQGDDARCPECTSEGAA